MHAQDGDAPTSLVLGPPYRPCHVIPKLLGSGVKWHALLWY